MAGVYKTFPCKSGTTSGVVVQNFAITIDGMFLTYKAFLYSPKGKESQRTLHLYR